MIVSGPGYGSGAGPLAIAHRGGAGLAGENTIEAFRRSHALGFRYLEMDLRLTSDGHVVVFHDVRLGRVTSARGAVRSRPLAELAALPVSGGGHIAAFEDVLTAFPDAHLTIDIKQMSVVAPLARLLIERGCVTRVCAAAMRETWLRRLHEHVGPQLITALPWRALARLAAGRALHSLTARFAHVPLRLGRVPIVRRDLIARGHDMGLRVIVWTVNDTDTMNRLLDDGADGIITDRPDLLREVLIARGQWRAPSHSGLTRSG